MENLQKGQIQHKAQRYAFCSFAFYIVKFLGTIGANLLCMVFSRPEDSLGRRRIYLFNFKISQMDFLPHYHFGTCISMTKSIIPCSCLSPLRNSANVA